VNNLEKINKITSKYLDKNIADENSSFDELKFDELDKIEFIMRLEEEFDIQITDEQADSFFLIKDVLKFLETSKINKV
jgi:acyl carrier protein